MKRFKVDEYIVREKGKEYSVLVFPFIKDMYAFNDWPEEDCYMVDGSTKAFSMLKYALAILIEASDKIIYFPCKKNGLSGCYTDNYNLVLCTPKAQFHRSSWIAIRRKLNASTKRGSYCLQYNRKKLDDFCRKKLFEKQSENTDTTWIYIHNFVGGSCTRNTVKTEICQKIREEHLEKLIGENLFLVLGKLECYVSHYSIAEELDKFKSGSEFGTHSALGWILPQNAILRMLDWPYRA